MARDARLDCYVDTSALIKRYLEETGSDEFEAFCELPGVRRLICPLGSSELTSALQRRVRLGLLTPRQATRARHRFLVDVAANGWTMLDFDAGVLGRADDLMLSLGAPLTTLDALHLACAVLNEASEFATADRQLAAAARKAKLRVHMF